MQQSEECVYLMEFINQCQLFYFRIKVLQDQFFLDYRIFTIEGTVSQRRNFFIYEL